MHTHTICTTTISCDLGDVAENLGDVKGSKQCHFTMVEAV